ncbi:MAG TPA: efflux RND transporter permease subunit, partial [Planctomycetaceae bacterium]|nr:efflux RND transporter permease subunit [Planctomycetaceae bacterium]
PEALISYDVTLAEVEHALSDSNQNSTGGYLIRGPMEYLVRGVGRATTTAEIGQTVVKSGSRSVLIRDVATVTEGIQNQRGDSSANGHPAVVLTITKQPDADTRLLTERVEAALDDIRTSLEKTNPDLEVDASFYQQRAFIDLGIHNVMEALRDGAILVTIILFLFLMNFRTTIITLTAIPLSLVLTALFFYWTGMSVNVMTLGGLAVAMGELVDDAIVDIENVYRRLQQNAHAAVPRPKLAVIYDASREIRSSIVFGTMLVILVFVPLFALHGIEGRMFTPLGISYIVSILASLLVSLTVTPVLASLLLSSKPSDHAEQDGLLLRVLKRLATPIIHLSCHPVGNTLLLLGVFAAIVGSGVLVTQLGSDFLPPFNEGAAQVNVILPPGSSLEQSNRVCRMVDAAFAKHQHPESGEPLIQSFVRRSGRAELDEHAEGVNHTEYILAMNPHSPVPRHEALAILRKELDEIPGIEYEAEQPLAHMLSHMLSGVSAQIAIKLYGDDLDLLRGKAQEIKEAITGIEGLAPPTVEPQQLIPQIRIELNREQLALYGITPGDVNAFIETALNGRTISTILQGQRSFDLVVRLDEKHRTDYANLHRLAIDLPSGERIPLASIAKVYEAGGPNTISRENARRRITIRGNTTDRDLGSVVGDIRKAVAQKVTLPEGYFVEYGGQFEAQQEATRMMGLLSLVSLAGVFLVLFTLFPSVRIVLQIMLALPIAFVGGVLALWLTGQTLTVASLVGFISLGGIAARNGILLVSHYVHLMKEEGEQFTESMILRGSLERLAPVLMTALTAGIGLIPLVIGGQQPGKEILYPVATVILGGLITSTICEYLVHPGLFWRFSGKATDQLIRQSEHAFGE